MILSAYGISDYSPLQVSEYLRDLRLSHTLEGGFIRHLTYTMDGLCKEQPVWPIVVDRVRAIPKLRTKTARTVLFVCDCRAALATTNIKTNLWPEHRSPSLLQDIKNSLVEAHSSTEDWSLINNEPSTLDYVESATKPSFVNLLQTALYKVTPYTLRKEVQVLMISYLAGTASHTSLFKKLKTSLKLQPLAELLSLPKAKEIREAVLMMSNLSVEEVSKKTGISTFELLYLSKSNAKTASGLKGKSKSRSI
jgi:hypothetical protein